MRNVSARLTKANSHVNAKERDVDKTVYKFDMSVLSLCVSIFFH